MTERWLIETDERKKARVTNQAGAFICGSVSRRSISDPILLYRVYTERRVAHIYGRLIRNS